MRKGRTIRLPPALKKECNKKYELSELEKHRANIRTILQCSNATPIRRHGGIGYICSFCTEQYQDPADLKAHTLQIHDKNVMEFMDGAKVKSRMGELIIKLDITSLQCKLCDSNFDMLHELVNHLVEDHDKKIYAVDKDHIFPLKFNGSILRCVICCNVFRKFKGLLEHMSTHYRNFICDVCDKGFVNRCMLMNHVGVHKIGVFHCTFCDKVFETAKRQRYHERSVHTYMSFSRQCSYCDLKFKDNTQRENHMRQFHGAVIEIKCQACDKTLRNQAAFNIHMKRDHLMERPHKCAECDMEFFRSDDLKDHMVKHSGEKLFQCAICLKSYGQRRTLMGHLRIHANDRRFKCEHCGVSFIQKCSLKTHMRSKHGE